MCDDVRLFIIKIETSHPSPTLQKYNIGFVSPHYFTLAGNLQRPVSGSHHYNSNGRVSASGNGRSLVRSRAAACQSCHVKNGTSCSSLGTQTYGVELGVAIMWLVWYHVKCLGHDTSVRQHYKSEHWAPYRNQTPSWNEWQSDVKPEQTTATTLL